MAKRFDELEEPVCHVRHQEDERGEQSSAAEGAVVSPPPPPVVPKERKPTSKPQPPLEERAHVLPDENAKEEILAFTPRNSSQHQYLQTLIKRMAQEKGFRVIVEEATPNKDGRVDVGLERNGKRIACEISITTGDEHELGNIVKCLKAEYDTVVLCSPDKKTLDKVRKLATQRLSESDLEKVLFFQPDELFFYLEQEAAREASKEERVKGYRVKVEYQPVTEGEKQVRREAIGQVVVQALRRLKDK